MDYQTALNWLYQTQLFGIKLGLDHPRRLLAALGHPEKNLRFIHVAGTNGKGSVCAFTASLLRTSGARVGLFTSPHLIDFRERITIGADCISEEETAARLTRLRDLTRDWPEPPTFFELTTALALDWFATQSLDWVVLETGMGGRLDATNVVSPELCLLTPVSFDHQAWLGNTLTAIASEKAGILKPGIPALALPQLPEAADVFRQTALALPCPLEWIESPWLTSPLPLAGPHQKWNAALAVRAARFLLPDLSASQIEEGLSRTSWPARFQIIHPNLVIDGAHNEAALHELVATWRERFPTQKPVIVFAALLDKPYQKMLALLAPIAREFWFVPLLSPRAVPPSELAALHPDSRSFPSIPEALSTATNAPVLVCGSLFLAGEVLAHLKASAPPLPGHQ